MSKPASHSVRQEVRAVLESVDGTVAVALRSLDPPHWTTSINAHERFHAASTMKTPVMVELFRQAHEGRLNLDDSIRVTNTFESLVDGRSYSLSPEDDSDERLYDYVGEHRPIRSLMRAMITVSSNLATNLLLDVVGAERTTRTMRRYGARHLRVRRGVGDRAAYRQGLNNVTSATDLLVLFERIARRNAVTPQASAEMIDILSAQQHTDLIPARLPDSVDVAHKTGWITGVRHDAGIVRVPDGPTYVLVLLSKNLADEDAGQAALARLSRIVFEGLTS